MTLKRTVSNPWLMAGLCLLAGLLGGAGGRRIALLALGAQIDELYDAIEALKLRMARREGIAGAEAKRVRSTTEREVVDELEAAVASGRSGGHGRMPSLSELAARAAQLHGQGQQK